MAPRKKMDSAQPKSDEKKPTRSQRKRDRKQQEIAKQSQSRKRSIQKVAQHIAQLKEEEVAKIVQMPVVNHHAAGIDTGDASHWVDVGSTPDGSNPVREFPSHTQGLRDLVAWLRHCGVTTVALEASGVYSHILFVTLQEAGLQPLMTSPQFTRQIKGRPKTDKRDCQWIRRLHHLGLLPTIFQPDEATLSLRGLVRERATLVREGGQWIQRMQKSLQLMNLKLTKVVSDITGVTGLKIIRAIIKGERDPKTLAKFRDKHCGHSEAEIALALDGHYRKEHLLTLESALLLWEAHLVAIARFDDNIQQQLKEMEVKTNLPPLPKKARQRGRRPHDPKFDVRTALYYLVGIDLTEIEGIDEITALTLLSELGTDFSKWPTVKHFTSWLGLCPNFKKTGGKVKSSQTRRGKNPAARALRMAAYSLMRSNGYLGAYLRRQRSRLGAPKAITATAHKLARILYNLLRFGVVYQQKTEADYQKITQANREKKLQRMARELGYELKKKEEESATTATT